ncbi:hypothetical protein [Frigoriflavimonas asaccharolytica]|uniref:Uncharacterized protein n=1 Tax=Frigoriflavimonas asaccharolytica TaxID=2735899 RepID=A0A8J8GAY8_9FLAO|nr:hypothetical protein [Frigoriflavimonas asaccharolytica]NRS92879.1 hypothetical protein [Frigoriflavimonas asaccharolytica]
MVKTLILLILATIIIFFTWNILKRIFFNKFYNYFGQNMPNQNVNEKKENSINQNVKWDAETVDYEEVKEDKYEKK